MLALSEARKRVRELGLEPKPTVIVARRQRLWLDLAERDGGALAATLRAVVVYQQVAGDRQQPGAGRRPVGVEPAPRPQRALERLLGQVLGVVATADPVGEGPVDASEMVVVCLFEIQSASATRRAGPAARTVNGIAVSGAQRPTACVSHAAHAFC